MLPMTDGRGEAKAAVEEKDDHEEPHGNARIGEIEDGAKEDKVLACKQRHPRWPIPFHKGEVKHINHFAVEQPRIAVSPRHERSHALRRADVENLAIEKAVDNVPRSTGNNQADGNQIALRKAFAHNLH